MSDDTIETLREQITVLREGRAAHAEQINAVATRVNEMSNDIKAILGYMERARGSWKMLVALGGAAAAGVEGIHQLLAFLHK